MDKKKIRLEEDKVRELSFEEIKKMHEGILNKKAFEYSNVMDQEDAYQLACIGLWNAYKKHDPDKGFKFFTLAYSYIDYAIKNESRKTKRHLTNKCSQVKSIVSMQAPIYEGKNGDEISLEEALSADDTTFDDIADNDLLQKLLNKLNPRQKEDIEAFINGEVSVAKLSEKYNMSKFKITRRINRSLAVLRKEYVKQIS